MISSLRRMAPRLVLIGLSLLLLWFALSSVSWTELRAIFLQLNWGDLLILALANGFVLVIFTLRWQLFLTTMGYRLAFRRLFGYRLAAFGVSYFTPGPHFGGEPLQVYLVHKRDDVPTGAAIATVTLDKLVELLANFTFLVLGAYLILSRHLVPAEIRFQVILYSGLLMAAPLVLLTAYWFDRHPLTWLMHQFTRIWPAAALHRFESALHTGEDQVGDLCRQQPGTLLLALLLSAVGWVAIVAEVWLATRVLGFNMTWLEVISILVAARIAILLPMPAGIGALEASLVFAMTTLGYSAAAGISLSLLIRARDITLGLLGLWIGGVDVWSAIFGRTSDVSAESQIQEELSDGALPPQVQEAPR